VEIIVKELDDISAKAVYDINELFKELSPQTARTLSREEIWHKPWLQLHLVIAVENEKIVGMASLCVSESLPKKFGKVEDVVVAKTQRGKQLGEKLISKLIDIGKEKKLRYIELTSKPTRIAANNLYHKLGFELRAEAIGTKGTNYYRLDLPRKNVTS